jgi:hypothetical protein
VVRLVFDASVVERDVNPPESLDYLRHRSFDLSGRRNVARNRQHFGACVFDGSFSPFQRVRLSVENGDARTFGSKGNCSGLANAARSSGDDSNLAGKAIVSWHRDSPSPFRTLAVRRAGAAFLRKLTTLRGAFQTGSESFLRCGIDAL